MGIAAPGLAGCRGRSRRLSINRLPVTMDNRRRPAHALAVCASRSSQATLVVAMSKRTRSDLPTAIGLGLDLFQGPARCVFGNASFFRIVGGRHAHGQRCRQLRFGRRQPEDGLDTVFRRGRLPIGIADHQKGEKACPIEKRRTVPPSRRSRAWRAGAVDVRPMVWGWEALRTAWSDQAGSYLCWPRDHEASPRSN